MTKNFDEKKVVYSGWMNLFKVSVNGKWYEYLENHDAVACIVQDMDNKILLVEQFRPALLSKTLEIPAGCIDKGNESKEQIMIEELKEEADLDVDVQDIKEVITYKPIVGFSNSTMHIYEVKVNVKGEDKEITGDDVSKIKWVTISEWKELIESGYINDSKTMMAYYYFMSQKR
ncbi:NUDIX hydrolase [Lutibacter sp. B2]|nr:NUDIX hydrolase [Lutibacter sp. B2]